MQAEQKVIRSSYLQQTILLTLAWGLFGVILFVTADHWRADLNQYFHHGKLAQGTITEMFSAPQKHVYTVNYSFDAIGSMTKGERFIGNSFVRPETYSRIHIGEQVSIRYSSSNPEISSVEGEKNYPFVFPIVGYLFISFTVLVIYRLARCARGMA